MDKYNEDTEKRLPTATVGDLRKLLNKLGPCKDETQITLEFVLVGLFPNVWNNVMAYGNDCYTKGYLQGLKDSSNED